MSADVSVVVCTYNRAALLRDTLASLAALETGGSFTYEVVVVDNSSTDDTPAVIATAAAAYPVPLLGVREVRPGVASARNAGIRAAMSPWIAFFDDDQVADPRWLVELLTLAREKGARCVGGANRLRLPAGHTGPLPPVARGLLSESDPSAAVYRYTGRSSPGTGNLLIQKSVFDEVGVFNEGLREAGEDTDLFRRVYAAGIEAWHSPAAISYHVIPAYRLTEGYLRWRCLRNGGHVARRNHQSVGAARFLLGLSARLGQALVLHLPRLAWARLARDPEAALGARCLLWRTQGYARFALSYLAPRLFAQREFFAWLEFRSERDLFAA
jgi:glycosyltransferase involved in cell wall biosynthesis